MIANYDSIIPDTDISIFKSSAGFHTMLNTVVSFTSCKLFQALKYQITKATCSFLKPVQVFLTYAQNSNSIYFCT